MKNLCEIFEYLSFCDSEAIVKEIRLYCKRIIENHGNKSEMVLKLDVERLNTFFGLAEFLQTSTVDKPGVTPKIRIRRKDVEDLSDRHLFFSPFYCLMNFPTCTPFSPTIFTT